MQAVDRAMRAIPVEEHAHVQRAVVILRLAMALNQDRASDLQKVVVRCIRSGSCWSCCQGGPVRNWNCGR